MLLCKIISVCVFALVVADAAVIQDSATNDKGANYRLPNHARPRFYDIKLNPHLGPNNFTFDGEILVHIEILNRTRTLTLHTKGLVIDEDATFLKTIVGFEFYVPTTYQRNALTEFLSLGFDEDLPAGYYMLHLRFTGVLSDKPYGFYRSSYTNDAGDTVWFAGSNFMATYARAAFPCWDEPALKAVFRIAIKHRRNYTAVSNMPISTESEIDESDGKTWTHFEESPVMSTYLVGFLISDLRNISNSDGTVNVWSRGSAISSASFAHEVAQKAALELERYTNGSVRVSKIDHVALPGLSNVAAESWGLITYRQDTILYDEDRDPIDALYGIAVSVVHQSSYQWLGNAISPSWWTNIWMNRGLAEYFKYYITDKIYKDWRLMELLVVRTLHTMLITDSSDYAQPLNSEPDTIEKIQLILSSQADRKAFLVLRMLSHCLSDDVLHEGLIRYFNKHKYGVADPDDLWNALQNALDESTVPRSKFKIREVMDTWTGQKGYPLVTVATDQHTGKTRITQEYFQPYKETDVRKNSSTRANKWWVPINFATRTDPDFTSTLATHWLSPEAEELIIENVDPHDWIIVNIQQTGFYRVNYDKANWLKIADYLDSENYTKIHVLNRAQIVYDAIFFMLSDRMDPIIFMEVTRYLRRETDYVAWHPVFRVLGEVTKLFAYNEGGNLLRPYILNMMNNIVEAIGTQDRPDDNYFTKAMRYAFLKEACSSGHPLCLDEAHNQLIAYLENSTVPVNRISSWSNWKGWIFCNGVKQANETVWDKLLYLYTNKSESTLYCLGHSWNQTIIEKFLNMTISEDSPITKKDIPHVFQSVMNGDFPNIDIALDFIIHHWDKLATILDDPTDLLYDIGWAIISRKQIQKVKAFLGKCGMEVPHMMRIREQNMELAEAIVNKIRLWLEHQNSDLSTNIASE